jgi:hypothetical protein
VTALRIDARELLELIERHGATPPGRTLLH